APQHLFPMNRHALPFVAPFFLFMVFLAVEGWFPDQHYAIYPLKTLLVTGIIAWYWRSLPSLKPSAPLQSALIGIIGVILWIGLDRYLVRYDLPLIGRNPFILYPAPLAGTLFAFRLLGIALVVPVMEELFWRGFLMRWLIREDFTQVRLGEYKPFSFFTTTALFAAEHGPEWPLGAIDGLLYGVWFVRKKNLGDVMTAHGVTNLLLALYCLASGDWHFLSIVAPGTK
ncbi:MAG TPA: CAAX prenyl protease-related protein, partial [Candidatus Methylacidiphilales bacterium]|nr:CAAX prenyl protease-related protein [Candidatus Methylacidiphilales bacterium]